MAIVTLAPATVSADARVASGYACKSGNYVYYSFTSSKKSTAIYRINIKNYKKSKVFPKKKSKLKAFTNLNVKGKFIYCACRTGNSLNSCRIYRINMSNGKTKKLAYGLNPTLVGNNIVFDGTKSVKVNDSAFKTYVPTGRQYAIDKKGGKKKKANIDFKSVETTCRGTKISSGKYSYYITSDGKKIYRQRGNKTYKVCKAKKITGFRVLKGYLVVKTKKGKKNNAYLVKNNGSKSVKLLSW